MTDVRPGRSPLRRVDLAAAVAAGAGGVGGLTMLHLRDPHRVGSYGTCPFLAVTGLPCPGCGGLRAVNDLTHGHVVAAASSNLLAVALLAGLAVAWAVWVGRVVTGRTVVAVTPTAWWGVVAAAVVVLFGVVRNLPAGAWLLP